MPVSDWRAGKEVQWQALRDRLAAGEIALPTSEDLRKELPPPRWADDLELSLRYMVEGKRRP